MMNAFRHVALLALAVGCSAAEGLSGTYFADAAASQLIAGRDERPESLGAGVAAKAARFSGSLVAPRSGTLRLASALPAGASGRLLLRTPDLTRPGGWAEREFAGGGALAGEVAIERGAPIELVFELTGAASAPVTCSWDGGPAAPLSGWETTPALASSGVGEDWLIAGELVRAGPRWRLRGAAASATVTADGDVVGSLHLSRLGGPAVARAGLVLAEPDGRQVTLMRAADGGIALAASAGNVAAAKPAPTGDWLRLRRNGPTVIAEVSSDGRGWRFAARADLPGLRARLRLGIASAGGAEAEADNLLLAGAVPLGMNLGPSALWGGNRPLVDLVQGGCGPALYLDADGKTAEVMNEKRQRMEPKLSPLDEQGWPTSDFQFRGPYNQEPEGFNGRRHLVSFTGRAQVCFSKNARSASAIPADAAKTGDAGYADGYDAATNRSRWYLVSDAPSGLGTLAAMFRKTQRTPDSPVGSGVTGLSILMPGYETVDYALPFTREWLDLVGQARVLRFMDWGRTNGSGVTGWGERTLPGPRAGGDAIEAYEHMVALCNATGADMWVNIPALADDDYIRNLARLIKEGSDAGGRHWEGLRPDLNVYVEYSNECWNFGFRVFKQLNERLPDVLERKTAFGPKGLTLDYDQPGAANPGDNALHYRWIAANLAGRVVPIFAEVFGADQVPVRVRPVLAGWQGNLGGTVESGLRFLVAAGWEPQRLLYAISPTGYFGSKSLAEAGGADTSIEDWTTEQGLAAYGRPVESRHWLAWSGTANAYGLQMMAYEAGPCIGQSNALGAAQVDPRFRTIVVKGFNAWFAAGGGPTNWFSASFGHYGGRNGDWIFSDNRWDLNHPRWQGFQDLAQARRAPPLCLGEAVGPGVSIDADHQLGGQRPVGATWSPTFSKGGKPVSARYALRSTRAQDLDLRLGVSSSGVQLSAVVGAGEPVPWPLPDSASGMATSAPLRLHLLPGINQLELRFAATDAGDEAKPTLVLDALDFSAPGVPAIDARPWLEVKFPGKGSTLEVPEGGRLVVGLQGGDRDGPVPAITLHARGGVLPDSALTLEKDPKRGQQLVIDAPAGRTGSEQVEITARDAAGNVRVLEVPAVIVPPPPRKLVAEATPEGVRLQWIMDGSMKPDAVIDRQFVRKDVKDKDWEEVARLTSLAVGPQQWLDPLPVGTVVRYRLHCEDRDGMVGASVVTKPTTSQGGASGAVAAPNLLSGRTMLIEGSAEPAAGLSDGLMVPVDVPGKSVSIACTGIDAPRGIDVISLWFGTFTNGQFVPDPIPNTTMLGTVTVLWTDQALTGVAALDPAKYTACGPAIDFHAHLPTRRLPGSETWSSDFGGLAIPAGAKGLLLRFANKEAKRPLQLREIQAFAGAPATAPAGLRAEAGTVQSAPATFTNPIGASVTLRWDAAPAGCLAVPVVERCDSGTFAAKGDPSLHHWTLAQGLTTFVNDRDDQAEDMSSKNQALANGATYHYRVGWMKPGGAVLWAEPVTVATPALGGTLPAVAGFAATCAPGRQVELSWKAVPGATAYKLERALTPDFKNGWAGLGELTGLGWTDRSVDPGATYYYRVRASTGGLGDGPWPETLSVTTPPDLAPPSALAAIADVGTVELRWEPPVGRAYAYEVLRGPSADHLAVVAAHGIGTSSVIVPSWRDVGVPVGTWYYAVRCVSYDGTPSVEARRSPLTAAVMVAVP